MVIHMYYCQLEYVVNMESHTFYMCMYWCMLQPINHDGSDPVQKHSGWSMSVNVTLCN